MTIWLLPIAILIVATVISVPLSKYLAWIMEGKYRAPRFLRWFESRMDSGEQTWKRYAVSLIFFNGLLFVFGFLVLALSAVLAAEPR